MPGQLLGAPGTAHASTTGIVGSMGAAGCHHALMVDAPNWGQDWSGTMRDNASRPRRWRSASRCEGSAVVEWAEVAGQAAVVGVDSLDGVYQPASRTFGAPETKTEMSRHLSGASVEDERD
ncbi:hypothetical protein ACWCPJ_33640 [Streptomyces collinus]|uniref:hypothetical protein n=1 Tax=Streptomyces collinus TaxID=42684 RepID=UPI0036D09292